MGTITRERFEQGLTYDQYKAQMTRNQERFQDQEQFVQIAPEDLEVFQRLPQPLNVVVLAEDWCGDVINNLPILGRLAEASGKLNVRVFLRDQNLDLMDQYLKEGQFRSIPVFAFFDQDFHEVDVFIERPASVSVRLDGMRQRLSQEHPEVGTPDAPISQLSEEARAVLGQAMMQHREQNRQQDIQDVIRDLRELVAYSIR